MVAYDPIEKLKQLAPHVALTLPIHYLEVYLGHGHYLPTTQVHAKGLQIQPT
jgi:hypothetical protein